VARDFSHHWKSDVQHDLVFVCGRYEGIDERFIEKYVQEIYSLGDFVLTGGEIAIMAMIDSALRFNPGALGNQLSSLQDSFEDGLLEHPQYTRPLEFEGMTVPDVLLSGHHKNIEKWQIEQKKMITQKLRPKL
jgi:tRNA (guanine37-N1)-methyltransferase